MEQNEPTMSEIEEQPNEPTISQVEEQQNGPTMSELEWGLITQDTKKSEGAKMTLAGQ